jgi:hypothetical protein
LNPYPGQALFCLAMVKVANILLAFFLALAPGMDATRLLHSLAACDSAAEQVATQEHEGHHHHGEEPCNDRPQQECPHFKNFPHGSPVLALAAPVSVFIPGPPVCATPLLSAAPQRVVCKSSLDSRPPPGPPLVGCVKLLI